MTVPAPVGHPVNTRLRHIAMLRYARVLWASSSLWAAAMTVRDAIEGPGDELPRHYADLTSPVSIAFGGGSLLRISA